MVLGGDWEGYAWREVEEDGGLRCVWWGRRRRDTFSSGPAAEEEFLRVRLARLRVNLKAWGNCILPCKHAL